MVLGRALDVASFSRVMVFVESRQEIVKANRWLHLIQIQVYMNTNTKTNLNKYKSNVSKYKYNYKYHVMVFVQFLLQQEIVKANRW